MTSCDCGNAGLELVIPGASEPRLGPAAVNPSPGGVRLPFASLGRAR